MLLLIPAIFNVLLFIFTDFSHSSPHSELLHGKKETNRKILRMKSPVNARDPVAEIRGRLRSYMDLTEKTPPSRAGRETPSGKWEHLYKELPPSQKLTLPDVTKTFLAVNEF